MKRIRQIIVFTALLSGPLVALAHAHLTQSDPPANGTLTSPPAQFTLKFSESAHLTALSVQKDGDPSPVKITALPQDASDHFSVPAPKLAAGSYVLRFRNVATDDGHVTAGIIKFKVAAP
jgi:methionine-rich copper-binding protein CopC